LKKCDVRWPLVLFLHGRPPCDGTAGANDGYFRRWTAIPAALAKGGYVVVAPGYGAVLMPSQQLVASMLRVIDWVRDIRVAHPGLPSRRAAPPTVFGWENARFVDMQRTAVIGHSWGGLLAAAVAAAQPAVTSYIGLDAGFLEQPNPVPLLQGIPGAKLFIWKAVGGFGDLIDLGVWDNVGTPKHAAEFPGEHFDFLPPTPGCNAARGGCPLIEAVTADLCALFIARTTPVGGVAPPIPVSLAPPDVALTPTQQFFGANRLDGLRRFASQSGCSMTLQWETPADNGSRQLGPARRQRTPDRLHTPGQLQTPGRLSEGTRGN
jgi:pimeloyl-ACP methyl ester carboxylesterase